MAKRHLGLGAAAKAKKRKQESPEEATPAAESAGNELTVELGEEVDANDTMAQLQALWRSFLAAEEKAELMVNGIIHECDRIVRKVHNKDAADDEKIELSGRFWAIYALALAALALFHAEDVEKVREFFAEAADRIETGTAQFPELAEVRFAGARVLINKIPLAVISQLTVESKIGKATPDVAGLLDESLAAWEAAELLAEKQLEYHHYDAENADFLQALDDLLEMVDNFGRDNLEGDDSEDENDDAGVELGPKHPLYAIRNSDKYNLWWREHTEQFLAGVDKANSADASLRRELCKRLGDSLLMEAEVPSNVFTTLTYYSKGAKSMDGLTREEAQKISQDLYGRALGYLKQAQDDEDPDLWATVAEALISLGNTHELDSAEQEKIYKEAEEILVRANNATNGKYENILENLVQG